MCLLLLTRSPGAHQQVLLGEKLTGFGTGRMVAPGGHVEPGESAYDAALREMREETGLSVPCASWSSALTFHFPAGGTPDLHIDVFLADRHTGTLTASSELDPFWCPVADLPLTRMWDDDRYWLARVLAGERLTGRFVFAADGTSVAHAEVSPTGKDRTH